MRRSLGKLTRSGRSNPRGGRWPPAGGTLAAGVPAAFAVNTRNYAIPRLRSVSVEQDYEVGNQRRVIVATQSLGFEELVADTAGNRSAVKIDLAS